jgi:hypothetical protein
MSAPNNNSGKDMGAAKARLLAMEATRLRLRAEREEEERRLEAEIAAEAARVEEEEREEKRKAEIERIRKAELAERLKALEEHRRQVEAEQGNEVEYLSGPSSKKRKVQESVSNKSSRSRRLLIQQQGEMERTGGVNTPSCKQCRAVGEACQQKSNGPSCWRCFKRKVGCSLAEKDKKKRKVEVLIPPKVGEEGEGMGELVGVARGILGALRELVTVGKGIEGQVKRWVEEDFEYRGGWHPKAETAEKGVGTEEGPTVVEGKGKEKEVVELDGEEDEEDDGDGEDDGGDGEDEGDEGEGA